MNSAGETLYLLIWFVAGLAFAALAAMLVMSAASKIYVDSAVTAAEDEGAVTLRTRGLIRIFQTLVITATVLGLLLFGWRFLPVFIAPATREVLELGGMFAIAPHAAAAGILLLQPMWIICAIGLCCFQPWARPLFVGTYAFSTLATLIGGLVVWLPWELTVLTLALLCDGAVLALAFLPPLSGYFKRHA